jgi:catalase
MKDTIKSRRVAILAAEGYNHAELTQVRDALKQAGAQCKIVSKYMGTLKSVDGSEVEAVKNYETTASIMFDAVFVPGWLKSINALKTQGDAVHFINEAFKHCKAIGATGEGVNLLRESDIAGVSLADPRLKGKPANDTGVVTLRDTTDLSAFIDEFIRAIADHRHWDRQRAVALN